MMSSDRSLANLSESATTTKRANAPRSCVKPPQLVHEGFGAREASLALRESEGVCATARRLLLVSLLSEDRMIPFHCHCHYIALHYITFGHARRLLLVSLSSEDATRE